MSGFPPWCLNSRIPCSVSTSRSHLFFGTYASGEYTSLDPLGWGFIPGGGAVPAQQTGSSSLLYILEQELWVDPCNEKRSIGLLSEWGLADPETSPYEWVGNVSLQAQGLVAGRELDTMGIAYFYSGLSGQFKDLLSGLGLRDLQGVELYYNASVTSWFHLTADLQFVEPALSADDAAIVFGLRGTIDL